jgi:DNA-binding NtrC family response regulator
MSKDNRMHERRETSTESLSRGGGAAMRALLDTAARVALSRIPVVVHGETGTGKEVLARFIHERGLRAKERLVRVNCGAIPASLVESTLFGHEKGSFTGAVQRQRGLFEEADRGTLFLDEIGDLPLAAQVALLRVLESGSFCRVGSTEEVTVDVRIIAATHRDLEAMVEERKFREDLYYRLSTMVLEIPPLRERFEEIQPLSMRFLGQANEANGRRVRGFSEEAMALLLSHRWPGNVRELRNAVERAVVVAQGELIQPEDLPARVRIARGEGATDPGERWATGAEIGVRRAPPGEARARIQQYQARIIEEALRSAGWSRAEAAERLGMPLRTLARKIKALGIKSPKHEVRRAKRKRRR